MRRLLLLAALVSAATAASALPASAAPDAAGCTEDFLLAVALYDGPLESYPAFLAGATADYAACVA